jgi:adenylate cyclase class IV
VLAAALGVRGEVRKRRELVLVGQTRVHLDVVEGLGTFVELEVVLEAGQSDADGEAVARALLRELGLGEADLLPVAYIDLLEGP